MTHISVKEVGNKVVSILGARNKSLIMLEEDFRAISDEVIVTTDDGSFGTKGRVAEGLKELDLGEFSQIYLCGPEPMMWDIISRTKEHAGKTQACINRYFKCAIGICGSCCIDPQGIRACVEGPVIMADRLLEGEFGRYRRGPTGGKQLC